MIPSLVVIGLAFTWMLYEADWMRVRLPVGAIKESAKTIRIWQYHKNGIYGITNRSETYSPYHITRNDMAISPFHAGITEPICGWDWLLNHEHPIVEYKIALQAHGCKSTITLCDNPEVDYGRIIKEVCSIALKANIRRNGHKPKKHKGETFNPYYTLSKPKRRTKSKARRCKC